MEPGIQGRQLQSHTNAVAYVSRQETGSRAIIATGSQKEGTHVDLKKLQ